MGLSYRFLQFQRAVLARPSPSELARVKTTLTPELFGLFAQLQRSEQAHSLRIFNALRAEAQTDPDLLAAALLHDIGKSCYPLRLWDRVVIVLAKAIFPRKAEAWGEATPQSWRRPFVVARQHPAWGAEMARQSGASRLVVEIIRRHQDPLPDPPTTPADHLLVHLKRHDDQS